MTDTQQDCFFCHRSDKEKGIIIQMKVWNGFMYENTAACLDCARAGFTNSAMKYGKGYENREGLI